MNLRHVSILSLFKAIESKTDYRFVYSNDLIPSKYTVSIEVRETPVSEVLSHALDNTGLDFRLMDNNLIVVADKDNIRNFLRITGKVTDINGEPLEGVSVTIKGSSGGALTDTEGFFSLNANANAELVFSYVGYEAQTIAVNNRKSITIILRGARELENVIVVANTGYQNISPERATGAYDVIGRNVLDKRPVSNLSTALVGMVAGMQGKENADGTASFLVRGTSSLYSNTQPLVVVDGFPIADYDFSTINPNDVQSITVLKDAAAASIWGARSANGVIVITTKKGRAGKLRIEGNYFTRISDRQDLDQILVQANSPDHIRYEKLAWDNNWMLSPYAGNLQQVTTSPLTLAQEYMWKFKQGQISQAQRDAGLDSLSNVSNRGQVNDYLMRRAVLNQFNLTMSGSTSQTNTYLSLLYENDKLSMQKSGSDRLMVNFNNQYSPAKWLKFSIASTIQYKKTDNSGATISEIQGLSPYETLLDPNGAYSVNLTMNREQLATLPLEKFPYADWNYNLLRETRGRKFTNENISARFQAGMNVDIFKGLSLDVRFQFEKKKIETENYYSDDTYYARNMVNTMAKYNQGTQRIDTLYIPKGGILTSGNSNQNSHVLRGQLNYDRSFGRHNVTVIAGSEMSQYTTTGRTNPTAYGYDPETLQSTVPQFGYGSSVDLMKNFLNNDATIAGGNSTFSWERDRYLSFYGNAAYTYNGRYTLSGSARSDASNFITDDKQLRWAPLWSVGAMWNIGREDFMRSFSWINVLKLRATYGRNGNAEKSTSTKPLISLGSSLNATTGTYIASVSSYGNPYLRWEKTNTTNIGVDFAFLNSKISGKLDYYNKHGQDIMGTITLPGATGVTSQRFNNAEVMNTGIELELTTNVRIANKFGYSPTLTYAYNQNEIRNLYFPNQYAYALVADPYVQGRPVGAVYSYTYAGMIDGTPHVEGLNKAPHSFNVVSLHNTALGLPFMNYEGTNIPPHTLGWFNQFTYDNFYLTALVVGKFGGVYRNPIFNYATGVGSSKTSVSKLVSDVFAGDQNIPEFGLPNNAQYYLWDRYAPYLDVLVERSDYVELKELSLGYNLPTDLISRASFKSARVFFQVRNLGLLYKANSKGYHPEWLPGSIRPVTTYTIGANVQL